MSQMEHGVRRAVSLPGATDQPPQLTDFMLYCTRHTGRRFATYLDFERFALAHTRDFWRLLLQWTGLPCEGSLTPVLTDEDCETARFFPGLRLNYVENLLRLDTGPLSASQPALTALHATGAPEHLTRGALRARVSTLATALSGWGLMPADRVALVAANTAGCVCGALAAAALGCTVSTGAPEMGVRALAARLSRIRPVLLMVDLPQEAAGADRKLRESLAELVGLLPSLKALVLLDEEPIPPGIALPIHRATRLYAPTAGVLPWPRLPFNHPLFILFTSGTTGAPKCLVHGAGGTLLEHVKEHRLHCDLRPGDRLFFQTSTGWMMWNWQLSALASGVEVVLYDGPVSSPGCLWEQVAEQQVTVFGTSPAYLKLCESTGWRPPSGLSFGSLRAVLSTGSILHPQQQDWLSDTVKPIGIQSISGGTDIIGCFVLGNPLLPVYAGECQCRSLGLDVRALPLPEAPGEGIGELVCANPFPSRPIGFLDDPEGKAFHAAYFSQHPGLWTHGDLIEFTPEGSARMHGRSDGVLNIRGIRVGPAEIYQILAGLPQISESMAVEQAAPGEPGGSRLVLLVVMRPGERLDEPLQLRIRRELRQQGSAAHVPAVILEVPELPVTHSGKRSERAARDALNGRPLINTEALRNPACLEPLLAFAASPPSAPPPPSGQDQPLQSFLAQVWERALGISPIGPDDNFFDLGGDSIAALKICAQLATRLGREIPVTLLFKAPTLTALTRELEAPAQVSYQPLWLLHRESTAPTGDAAPLYIVHGFGGCAMELVAVARQLRTPGPVYALQARGFEQGDAPHETVESMAQEYLSRVRELQPHGPYLLAGYSFGGLVAYEMARLLVQAGEQISRLVLLDTGLHERHWPYAAWLELASRRLTFHLHAAASLPPSQWPALLWRLGWAWMRRCQRALMAHLPDDPEARGLPEAIARVRRAALAAMAAYHPQPSKVDICLIRSDLSVSRACDPALIWKGLVPAMQVHDVTGDHLSMLRSPHLPQLADALSRALTLPGRDSPLVLPGQGAAHESRAAG